jgi:Tol biopolymer transport system component
VTDLKERFQSLDRVPAPDLWRDISRREPADVSLGPQWRRVAVAALAFVIAAAGMGVATWAFVVNRDTRRVDRPAPVAAKSNGKIAFFRGAASPPSSPGQSDLFLMNGDGSSVRRLTHGNLNLRDADWSPNGQRLAMVEGRAVQWDTSHIVIANADGTGMHQVTTGSVADGHPRWSPDGTQILFERSVFQGGRPSTDYDLYLMRSDGTDVHPVFKRSGWQLLADWSPDGTRIVFVGDVRAENGSLDLMLINPDGTGLRSLTRTDAVEWSPRWSPDGSQIAFTRSMGDLHDAIVIVDSKGTHEQEVYRCTDRCTDVQDLVWAPDGTKIAFTADIGDGRRRDIFLMDADGANVQRLAKDACCPAWQPIQVANPSQVPEASASNGEIWFQRGRGEGGVWVESVQPDGSDVRVLFTDAWAGGSDDVGSTYDWASDGSRLAFIDSSGERIEDAPTGSSWDVFTMNADGTGRQQVTHDGSFDAASSWSPVGDRIAYASDLSDPDRPGCEENVSCTRDIYVINADGSGQVQLTVDSGNAWQPDWSPDGNSIVFVRDAGDIFSGDIYVMSVDGTNVTALTQTADGESQPRWSPDGTQIAFVRGDGKEFSLYVMAADGSDARLLATGLVESHSVEPDLFQDYSWSPDGTSIAFAAGEALSVVDVDTGAVTNIREDQTYGLSNPSWRPIPG